MTLENLFSWYAGLEYSLHLKHLNYLEILVVIIYLNKDDLVIITSVKHLLPIHHFHVIWGHILKFISKYF